MREYKKSLIVDDMERWHTYCENNLKFFGCEQICHAYDTASALGLLDGTDLILIDINFDPSSPGNVVNMTGNLEGLDLCARIKKLDLLVDVVMMSSILPEDECRRVCKERGADYFIPKPRLKEEIEVWMMKE